MDKIDYDLDLAFLDSPKPEPSPVVNGNQAFVNGRVAAGRPGFPMVDRSTKPKPQTSTPVAEPVEKLRVVTEPKVTPPAERFVPKQVSTPEPAVQQVPRPEPVIKDEPTVVTRKGSIETPPVNRALKPGDVTAADVRQAEKEQFTKEQELEHFKLETQKLIAEHRARLARLEDDQRQLDRLDLLKRQELKETADIMRMKKKVKQEMEELEKEQTIRLQEEEKR